MPIEANDLGYALQRAVAQLVTTHKLADLTLKQNADLNRTRVIMRRISSEAKQLTGDIANFLADRELGVEPEPKSDDGNTPASDFPKRPGFTPARRL